MRGTTGGISGGVQPASSARIAQARSRLVRQADSQLQERGLTGINIDKRTPDVPFRGVGGSAASARIVSNRKPCPQAGFTTSRGHVYVMAITRSSIVEGAARHFALETHAREIAESNRDFLAR